MGKRKTGGTLKKSSKPGQSVGKLRLKRNHIHFKIMGKPWVAIVLDRARYTKKHGDDSVAITEVHDRQIYFGPEGRSYETIVHELTHGYLVEMCVHSADLDRDALEEIFCELMGKRGDEILALGKKLALEILKREL